MTQTADVMECPRCKEISLRLVDEEVLDEPDAWVETYECDECGHIECHTSGLPSWHWENEGEATLSERNRGDDDE